MWFLTLLLFIFILGIIVLVHELGHFLWAKKFGVFIYEFSIGMGPVILSKKGKDGINYNIRALPIGGFVSMAGEVYEDDKEVPKERCLCNKPVWQRVIVMAAGVFHNFVLAIILLFVMAIFWGSATLEPQIKVMEGYPVAEAGIVDGDKIIAINNRRANTLDEVQILLYFKNPNDYYKFKIKHADGSIDEYKITPKEEKSEDGTTKKVFGIYFDQEETHGLLNKIKFAFGKFASIVGSMYLTIVGLLTGKISINALSGPVGIYSVVGESIHHGLSYVVYLIAYLSINVGVINILPFPAFDGGRIFFLIIEKLKGSPVNQKFENWCHTIGFILLMILIIFVTIHDIIKLF